MSTLVEVEQKVGGKILVNLDTVEKIVPAADKRGSVLHFNSSYLAIFENLDYFSKFKVKEVIVEEEKEKETVEVPSIKSNKVKKETV